MEPNFPAYEAFLRTGRNALGASFFFRMADVGAHLAHGIAETDRQHGLAGILEDVHNLPG